MEAALNRAASLRYAKLECRNFERRVAAVAENMQDNLNETASDQACDPVFQQEQDHLSDTYAKLEAIAKNLSEKMERRRWQAHQGQGRPCGGEVSHNFAAYYSVPGDVR